MRLYPGATPAPNPRGPAVVTASATNTVVVVVPAVPRLPSPRRPPGPPPVRLRVGPGVPPAAVREVRRLTAGFARASGRRHPLVVHLVGADRVEADDGSFAFGLFCHPLRYSAHRPVAVWVATRVPPADGRRAVAGGGPRRVVGFTLLHELVHYEQYRDRRPLTERGVTVRVRHLYRLIDGLPD